jgi:hypothetical protein
MLVYKLNLFSLFCFIVAVLKYSINNTEFVELAISALGRLPLRVLPEIPCN